ncbi:TPA: hypothetical protein MW242_003307 [Acinetobacter baumannii]|nr:hypothetical protein [Acinetobacter baumannii]
MNKKVLSIAIAGILLTGCSDFNNSSSESKDEPIDPITAKVENQVKKYDERVTTFNPKNYTIPVANISKSEHTKNCNFGIGGAVPGLSSKSIFSQTLFRLDAEQIMDKVHGDVMYAPYTIATSIEDDVMYETEIDSFDRQLNTLRSYQIKSADQNIISSSGFFKNTNKAVRLDSIRRYPVAYVKRMEGDTVVTSMFNDDCDKNVGIRNYKWREIDLSGKPYSSIASTVSDQIVRVNQFGMFTSASNFYSYFSNQFGNYLSQNQNFKTKLASAGRFPKGSKIYVPAEIQTTDETLVIMKSSEFEIKDFDKAKILDLYNKEAKLTNSGPITFKVYDLKNNISFYTPWNEGLHREAVEFDPIVIIDGKAYSAVWHLPNKLTFPDSSGSGSLTYFNSTAHNSFVNAVKGIYQGQQSMEGTEHFDDTEYSMKTAIEYQKAQASK